MEHIVTYKAYCRACIYCPYMFFHLFVCPNKCQKEHSGNDDNTYISPAEYAHFPCEKSVYHTPFYTGELRQRFLCKKLCNPCNQHFRHAHFRLAAKLETVYRHNLRHMHCPHGKGRNGSYAYQSRTAEFFKENSDFFTAKSVVYK